MVNRCLDLNIFHEFVQEDPNGGFLKGGLS